MQFLQLNDFSSQLNQTFSLAVGTASMSLTLIEIQPLQNQIFPGQRRDPFCLIFQGASPITLPQQLYKISHPDIGEIEMFLVPIGVNPGGTLYQAVYS